MIAGERKYLVVACLSFNGGLINGVFDRYSFSSLSFG